MNLTDEVLEMWEAEARAGSTDATAANARLLALLGEHADDTRLIAELTGRLCEAEPAFKESIQRALEREEAA